MTTIAANRGSMAADSLTATEDGLVVDTATQKITRIGTDLIGCEGDDDYIGHFLEWYRRGRDPEERPENIEGGEFAAVVLTAEGRLFKYFAGCYPIEHHSAWLTLGSGSEIAAGVMATGATPRRAVEIARELNVWTGGEIVEERI